jgi:DNA-binding response OmpR family regulator
MTIDAEKNVVFNSGEHSPIRAVEVNARMSQQVRDRNKNSPAPGGGGGDGVILVIEDDVHIGGLVGQVLKEAGYKIEVARDVGAARGLAAAGFRPAAMLSDLMIAGSAGPERLPSELRALFPEVPLTIMTGVPPKRRALMGVEHDRVIEKPFELEALLEAVREMVAGGKATPAP